MDMDTLQLIIEAGPNAATMFGWYCLSKVGEAVVIATGIISGLIIFSKGLAKAEMWSALTGEQKNEVAAKIFKLNTGDK